MTNEIHFEKIPETVVLEAADKKVEFHVRAPAASTIQGRLVPPEGDPIEVGKPSDGDDWHAEHSLSPDAPVGLWVLQIRADELEAEAEFEVRWGWLRRPVRISFGASVPEVVYGEMLDVGGVAETLIDDEWRPLAGNVVSIMFQPRDRNERSELDTAVTTSSGEFGVQVDPDESGFLWAELGLLTGPGPGSASVAIAIGVIPGVVAIGVTFGPHHMTRSADGRSLRHRVTVSGPGGSTGTISVRYAPGRRRPDQDDVGQGVVQVQAGLGGNYNTQIGYRKGWWRIVHQGARTAYRRWKKGP
ncbi:hypothetical protein [Nonomuraea sp. KM90]|uniref:hypothetical protein n=1 Tax=Nonomuraea sp. KM90 TaxID=3457428 RepID=UPI003FCE821A